VEKSEKNFQQFRSDPEIGGRKSGSLLIGTPTPPSPSPPKAATGAVFTKYACKILSPKELEVKILKTKHLADLG
jgi:hypothetical protein